MLATFDGSVQATMEISHFRKTIQSVGDFDEIFAVKRRSIAGLPTLSFDPVNHLVPQSQIACSSETRTTSHQSLTHMRLLSWWVPGLLVACYLYIQSSPRRQRLLHQDLQSLSRCLPNKIVSIFDSSFRATCHTPS